MGILQKILGPAHSIILAFDHIDMETLEELSQALDEIGEFYRFVPLSHLVQADRIRRAKGCASVVFKQSRVSVFLRAVPELKARGIPFALLVDPDCIGVNRLPIAEEQEILAQKTGGSEDTLSTAWLEKAWSEGRGPDSLRDELRARFGAIPVERLDPTRFFTTWGKIAELPRDLVELGVHFTVHPSTPAARELVDFARKTTGRTIEFGFVPRSELGAVYDDLGVKFVLTPRGGVVNPNTSLWEIPLFTLEKHEPDSALGTKS